MALSIENSWETAENAIFAALCKATNTTAKKDAFQGYLPTDRTNHWMLNSGDGDTEKTDVGCYSSLYPTLSIDGRWDERAKAMQFAGLILKKLAASENFTVGTTENVARLRPMTALPTITGQEGAVGAKMGVMFVLSWQFELGFGTSEA